MWQAAEAKQQRDRAEQNAATAKEQREEADRQKTFGRREFPAGQPAPVEVDGLIEDFKDPLAAEPNGRWLAAFEPVVVKGRPGEIADTGWVVIVKGERLREEKGPAAGR